MAAKKNGGWWKWLILILIAGLVAGGIWYFKQRKSDAPEYQTETVQPGNLVQTVTATGTLNPVVNVTVGSQVSGRISDLYVDYNSEVTKGQVIAEIDPSNYKAALEQATADLANAQANLELQQVQYRRSSELYTNNLISGSDYDIALASLHQAEATVKIKEASVHNAVVNLNYCKIVSPVNGVVISRAVELGQTVASSFNTPTLFVIANDLTKMQIDANVDEADVGGVMVHQLVDFTVDAYPDRTFHGIVTQVRNAPTTVNNVVTYDCVIGVTNSDYKLKPGMTANVSIVTADLTNVLEIPNAALRFLPPESATIATNSASGLAAGGGKPGGAHGHKGGADSVQHTVYVLKNPTSGQPDTLQPVRITTGITDNINTEVISGLQAGDEVVTSLKIPGLGNDQGAKNPFSGGHHRF